MALNRPGRPSVEGLEEAEQVVVAFGADEPLDGADEVVGVGGIDPDVRFGVILHEHWGGRWIAGIAPALGRVRPQVLSGVARAAAWRHARVAVIRTVVGEIGHLWRVATGLLSGGERVCHSVRGRASRICGVTLDTDWAGT